MATTGEPQTTLDTPTHLPVQWQSNSFLNVNAGTIGRTVSTKSEANTSSRFSFWIGKAQQAPTAPDIGLEIGNIIAAQSSTRTSAMFLSKKPSAPFPAAPPGTGESRTTSACTAPPDPENRLSNSARAASAFSFP